MQPFKDTTGRPLSAHQWLGPSSLPLAGVTSTKVPGENGFGDSYIFSVRNQRGVEKFLEEGDWLVAECPKEQHARLSCWSVYKDKAFRSLFRTGDTQKLTLESLKETLRVLENRFRVQEDGYTVKIHGLNLLRTKADLKLLLTQLENLEPVREKTADSIESGFIS